MGGNQVYLKLYPGVPATIFELELMKLKLLLISNKKISVTFLPIIEIEDATQHKTRPHLYARRIRMNAKKLLVQRLPHKQTSKRSAGYLLTAQMDLVSQKIVGSSEVSVHISMIANLFFFKVPTPDG